METDCNDCQSSSCTPQRRAGMAFHEEHFPSARLLACLYYEPPSTPTNHDEEWREIIREIMTAYDTARAAWLSRFGNAEGFDDWFRKQTK